MWGKPACRLYLLELLNETRDGTRAGFDPSIAKEILQLLDQHDKQYPHLDTTHDIIPEYNFGVAPRRVLQQERGGVNIVKVMVYFVIGILVLGIITKIMRML
jgi:hypothetical protein